MENDQSRTVLQNFVDWWRKKGYPHLAKFETLLFAQTHGKIFPIRTRDGPLYLTHGLASTLKGPLKADALTMMNKTVIDGVTYHYDLGEYGLPTVALALNMIYHQKAFLDKIFKHINITVSNTLFCPLELLPLVHMLDSDTYTILDALLRKVYQNSIVFDSEPHEERFVVELYVKLQLYAPKGEVFPDLRDVLYYLPATVYELITSGNIIEPSLEQFEAIPLECEWAMVNKMLWREGDIDKLQRLQKLRCHREGVVVKNNIRYISLSREQNNLHLSYYLNIMPKKLFDELGILKDNDDWLLPLYMYHEYTKALTSSSSFKYTNY